MMVFFGLVFMAAFVAFIVFGLVWIVAFLRKRPTQKPQRSALISFAVCVVALILTIATAGDTTETPTATPEPESTVQEEPQEDESAQAEEPTETPAPESDEENSGEMSVDLLAAAISLTLQENFENSDVTYDENSITMSVWNDNIAAGALLAQQGNEELRESWDEMRENLRKTCEAAKETVDSAGYEDVTVTLKLLNDMNQENILLTVVDGVVTEDVVYNYEM